MRFENGELVVKGVLPIFARSEAVTTPVPEAFVKSVEALEKGSKDAKKDAPVTLQIDAPAWFEAPEVDAAAKEAPKVVLSLVDGKVDEKGAVVADAGKTAKLSIKFNVPLDEQSRYDILASASPRAWKHAVMELSKSSQTNRVSGMWLFLSYLLATLGELCLSPVGLSMVTKLAPPRFASLFMGVWLLASSVAQYVGGSIGESWGKVPPVAYFKLFVMISVIGAGVLFALSSSVKKLMHDVK
jgi:POT family proton-dependent oligopeptide transporter